MSDKEPEVVPTTQELTVEDTPKDLVPQEAPSLTPQAFVETSTSLGFSPDRVIEVLLDSLNATKQATITDPKTGKQVMAQLPDHQTRLKGVQKWFQLSGLEAEASKKSDGDGVGGKGSVNIQVNLPALK